MRDVCFVNVIDVDLFRGVIQVICVGAGAADFEVVHEVKAWHLFYFEGVQGSGLFSVFLLFFMGFFFKSIEFSIILDELWSVLGLKSDSKEKF